MLPFGLQSVKLTVAAETAITIVAVSLYALGMAFALIYIAGVLPLWPRVLKLTYFTTLAASDFYSDLLYIFTQTFVNRALFGAALFFAFAPTLAYLTFSGLFWSFFTKMIPKSFNSAVGVWVIVFCGKKDLKFRGKELPEQSWLWIVLVECTNILRIAARQWRLDFDAGGDDFLKVLLFFVKFLLTSALGLFVLLAGLAGCVLMLVVTPVVAAVVLILGPMVGMVWCLVHVNFKLSIFPGATAAFYRFMQHEPPDPASTRSVNLSFLAEIVCESLPQFVILFANQTLLAQTQGNRSLEGVIIVYTLGSSALDLLSNFWPYLVWSCRHGSVSKALDEVIHVVTDDHAEKVKERNLKRKQRIIARAGAIPTSKVLGHVAAV